MGDPTIELNSIRLECSWGYSDFGQWDIFVGNAVLQGCYYCTVYFLTVQALIDIKWLKNNENPDKILICRGLS